MCNDIQYEHIYNWKDFIVHVSIPVDIIEIDWNILLYAYFIAYLITIIYLMYIKLKNF